MKNRKNVYPVVLLFLFVFNPFLVASMAAEEPVAYQLQVVQKNGIVFDGILRDQKIIKLCEENKHLDLSKINASQALTLYYVQGMNGSMGFQVEDLKSVTVLKALSKEDVADFGKAVADRLVTVRKAEQVRQDKLKEKRALDKDLAKAEAAARKLREQAAKKKQNQQDRVKWLTRFPPEKGWLPEKKQDLYRRSIAIGVYPNKEEKAFLDHYKEWLIQYNRWLKEQDKSKKEDKERSEVKN